MTSARADIIVVDGGSTDGSLEPAWLQRHGVRTLLLKTAPGKLSAQLRAARTRSRSTRATRAWSPSTATTRMTRKRSAASSMRWARATTSSRPRASLLWHGQAKNTPVSRDLAIRLIHAPLLSLFSGFRWTDTTQGFRAYSRKMLSDPRVAPFREVFASYELLAYLSLRVPQLGFRCIELLSHPHLPRGRSADQDQRFPRQPERPADAVQSLRLAATTLQASPEHARPDTLSRPGAGRPDRAG
ncbi:glycosyltransferase family 2 protein [Massilia sp. H-1]|nr:glycosyltransferase family 2 protein [Massilia sp. H-1]